MFCNYVSAGTSLTDVKNMFNAGPGILMIPILKLWTKNTGTITVNYLKIKILKKLLTHTSK